MNGSDRQLLLAVSGLLHYPMTIFSSGALNRGTVRSAVRVRAYPLREFIRSARSKGLSSLREEHVAIFDMDGSAACPLHGIGMGTIPGLGALWRA